MKALSRGNGQQSEQGRIAWGGLPWRGGISNVLGRSIMFAGGLRFSLRMCGRTWKGLPLF